MKFYRLFFYVLACVFIGLIARAEECETVDLRPHFGPVNDQQDIGWCYAYAGADLINYRYKNVLGSQKVSPFHMALLSNIYNESKINEVGGNTSEVIKLALAPPLEGQTIFNRGLCFQSMDDKIIPPTAKVSIKNFYTNLANLKKYFQLGLEKNNWGPFNNLNSEMGSQDGVIKMLKPEQLYELFNNSTNLDLGIHFIDYFCSRTERFYVQNPAYPVKFKLGGVKVVIPDKGRAIEEPIIQPQQLMVELKSQLNQQIPVEADIYDNFLVKASLRSKVNALHAVVVIGKEKINNECHLIVRNSWGDCNDINGKNFYSKNVTKCIQGNLWIKEKIFTQQTVAITYLR